MKLSYVLSVAQFGLNLTDWRQNLTGKDCFSVFTFRAVQSVRLEKNQHPTYGKTVVRVFPSLPVSIFLPKLLF